MKHPNIVAFREAFEGNGKRSNPILIHTVFCTVVTVICKCGLVYSADGLLCIIMEYCSGGDLLQRILQQKSTQFCTDDVGFLLHWFSLLVFSVSSVLLI